MTKEDLIAMARQAGFQTGVVDLSSGDHLAYVRSIGATCTVELDRFYSLAAARTREECADFCDEFQPLPSCNTLERHLWNVASVTLADGIRAMGERA